MDKLIIVGASGHGKVVADIAKACHYDDIAFIDDNKSLKKCGNFDVIGTLEDLAHMKPCNVVVAIGNASARKRIIQQLKYHKDYLLVLISYSQALL